MKSRGEGLVLPRHLLVRFLLGHGLGAIRRLGCGTPVSDLSRLLDRHEQEAKALALAEKGVPFSGETRARSVEHSPPVLRGLHLHGFEDRAWEVGAHKGGPGP